MVDFLMARILEGRRAGGQKGKNKEIKGIKVKSWLAGW
jgi:hypothetical protein